MNKRFICKFVTEIAVQLFSFSGGEGRDEGEPLTQTNYWSRKGKPLVKFRKSCRSATRRLDRALNRCCTRTLRSLAREDYVALALVAFGRACRAHQRLARLAPRLFDFAIVNRESAERRERLPMQKEIQRALDKIYGESPPNPRPSSHSNDCGSPIPKSPRTLRAMEIQYAQWQLWIGVAREKLALFRQRRPHALIPLTQLARLCEVSFKLKRLAVGLPEP